MTSSTAESSGETLFEEGGQEEASVDMDIEEEEEEDNESDHHLIGHPLTPISQEINQIDGILSVEHDWSNHCANPHSSTPEAFEANAAGELELDQEDNSIGKRSVNAQFCEASDEIRIHRYEKQDVSGGEMTDRKRLTEHVNYKLDATQIAEISSLPELTHSNKRPAIVCSFFAKGWCIKGKSCRFLHIKNGLASENKESVAVAPKQICEHPLGKDSSLAEDSSLDDGEILKQKNGVRGLLKGGPGFNAFLGLETWPILSGSHAMSSMSTSWKCLDSDPKYQASKTSHFQHYSLPSFASGLQYLPKTRQPAEYRTILFSNWENSIPFRPSHIITQRLLSSAKRCDAINDNVEQTHMRDKVSQCGQEAVGESDNVYGKAHANSVTTLCPENDSSNNLVSGSNFFSKEIQNDSFKIQSVNVETTVERQKCSLLTGNESSLNSIQSQSIVGADLVDVNDSEPCTDRQSHTTQPKMDFVGQDNGADVDLNSDANVHKESKELKIFQAALVERMKELLRQPWHDGLLSRDVYKLIVKKAVDKVISTMEPDQVPVTTESVKQYLFLFKGKLMKLVEAYVDKYGKSLPG